ncbi:MAG: glycosyltransferase family 9 protein [Minisyncoccia bacterium]|jgi:ADP-heptose:LPS heptosyltransferase
MKQKIKLAIKTFVPLIGYFLSKFKRIKNKKTDNKILIIFGGGIGDVVKRSIICEFIKKYLNDFEVYYLLPYKLKFPYAKEIFYFDYNKAKINPFYFAKLSENFKNFGFSKVIVLLPFWENFLWTLGLSVEPTILYVYDETPPSNFEKFLNKIYTHFFIFSLNKMRKIRVWSYFDKTLPQNIFPSDVYKQSFFISQIIKELEPNVRLNEIGIVEDVEYKTEIEINEESEKNFLDELSKNYKLIPKNYAVIGLGSSSEEKNWSVENFAKVSKYLKEKKGLEIVVVGGKESKEKVKKFESFFGESFINLVLKTDLESLCILIKNAKLVVANDTSFIHIGIAFKIPTICPIMNSYLGVDSLYGYEKINKWVINKNEKGPESLKKLPPERVIETIEEVLCSETKEKDNFLLFYNE